ncbi:hypothetical protein BSLA_03r1276 [Burkholderia stabilis]|nr:hypothetical protein BSLA_03r1276 [Burkholderia stabilis]
MGAGDPEQAGRQRGEQVSLQQWVSWHFSCAGVGPRRPGLSGGVVPRRVSYLTGGMGSAGVLVASRGDCRPGEMEVHSL